MSRFQPLTLAVTLVMASLTQAGEGHDHHAVEQHGTHVHGAASLTLALDGEQLEIEFTSPAMNLVGFEHRPANAEQQRQVDAVAQLLRQPNNLLELTSAAECRLQEAEIESGLLSEAHDKDHHDNKHQHDKEHAAHEHHEEETHSEFTARYKMTCSRPAALGSLRLKLFERYPALEKVQAEWIAPSGQGSKSLTAKDAVAKLQ